MYDNADQTPVLIASDSILNVNVITSIEQQNNIGFSVYPNPTVDGIVRLQGNNVLAISKIEVFSSGGKLVSSLRHYPTTGISLPTTLGVYLIRVKSDDSDIVIRVFRTE